MISIHSILIPRHASSRPARAALAVAAVAVAFCTTARAARGQAPVDFRAEIQPILDSSCGGGFCHLGQGASGVDLSSRAAILASAGRLYGGPVVVPGDAAASPLYDKIAAATPRFGERMPLDLPPLAAERIALIGRWIDEGATEHGVDIARGDMDDSGDFDTSDAVAILSFLFLGGAPPRCRPIADVNGDGVADVSDPIHLLSFLFLGGPEPAPISDADREECIGEPSGDR